MKSDLLEYFTPMLRARRFDEVLCEHGDLVNDTYHVSIGLETSAAGIACAREPGDSIFLNHRNHGQLAACGSDLEVMYREIFGRDGSPLRGKLGSFHLMDADLGIPYSSAMLGGGIPLAIGAGLASARLGKNSISFAYLGDGAMEEGIVYESFNIASAWNVPVVIVCDNNGDLKKSRPSKFCQLAEVCGLDAFRSDAQMPLEVFMTIETASEVARSKHRPQFVEVLSEPWPGNATGKHPRNVTGAFEISSALSGVDEWSLVDPLSRMVRELLAGDIEIDVLRELDQRISSEVQDAVTSALAAPIAPPSAIFEHVWGPQ